MRMVSNNQLVNRRTLSAKPRIQTRRREESARRKCERRKSGKTKKKKKKKRRRQKVCARQRLFRAAKRASEPLALARCGERKTGEKRERERERERATARQDAQGRGLEEFVAEGGWRAGGGGVGRGGRGRVGGPRSAGCMTLPRGPLSFRGAPEADRMRSRLPRRYCPR